MSRNPTTNRPKKSRDRRDVLLRAAYDLLTKAENAHFVEAAAGIVVFYDNADCDGSCLREDIADQLGIDDTTEPIPTKEAV